MNKENVIYQSNGNVGTVTLGGGPSDGRLSYDEIVSEFEEALEEIVSDSGVRVVVVSFLQGFSPYPYATIAASNQNRQNDRLRPSFSSLINGIDLPTIAAIERNAFGQTLEAALACDLRICTEGALFAMPHVAHGEIPWDGGTQRLPRLIGKGKALEMVITGEAINAGEAYRIGLVSRVVPAESLLKEAEEMARGIAGKAPMALRFAKEAICKGMDLTLDQGLRLEADLYFLLHTTSDRTEGVNAFREKRTPRFVGG